MKKKIIMMFISILLLYLFISCDRSPTDRSKDNENAIVDVSHISIKNYPRVDGSTSAHPLQIVIACQILGVSYKWYDSWDGTRRILAIKTEINEESVDFINRISHTGTHESYVNLIADSTDFILVAREPSKDEWSLAEQTGITLKLTAIALDAFVFILNIENPVNNLAVEQIRAIYTGNIINWKNVGGLDAAINPYQRNKNSGSQELMESLVMKELAMVNAPDLILHSMMGPINKLETDPYGIGYTVYFFNEFMAPRSVIKSCAVNNVKPDPTTIGTGQYIFTTRVYAVIRSDVDSSSTAATLWKWLQTIPGQGTVAESGYIPVVKK